MSAAAGHVLGGGKDGSAPGRNGGRGRGRGGARGGRGGAPQENGSATANPRNNNANKPAPKHADPTAAAAPAAGENRRRDGGRGGRNNRNTEAPQANGQQNGAQRAKPQQAAPAVLSTPAPFVATSEPENSAQKGKSDGKAFEALGLIAPLVRAVAEMGYINPSPVQLASIPKVLKEIDLLAGAQTGTGKTAAFSLPILQLLMRAYADGKVDPNVISVLCLTPTRELAAQIVDNITQYFKYLTVPAGGGKNKPMHCTVIFGGVGQGKQVDEIKNKKPQVLVATPGRLLDLHGQGLLALNNVKFLVLDEADRMLDMGFYPDVSKIIKLLPAKENRQTLLFSATFPEQIRSLSKTVLRSGAAEVQVTPPNTTVERIDQRYYLVSRDKKRDCLLYLLKLHNWSQVLVFCRTKATSNELTTWLNKNGITASALHGSKSQTSRTAALGGFKEGTMKVLVATDIAARGIDIEDLPHVVNYEVPHVSEDYVHRIGRTGRAGKKGYAINLVSLDEEGFMVNIIKSTKATIPMSNATDLPKTPHFGPAEGERAEPIPQGKQPALWGGLGPAPSREYMQQVAKENRREIARNMQDRKAEERRVREEKAAARGGPAPGSAPAAGRGGRGGGRGGRR